MLMEEQRLRLKLAMVMVDVLLHPVMHQHHSLQVADQQQEVVQHQEELAVARLGVDQHQEELAAARLGVDQEEVEEAAVVVLLFK
jgi:hypothetical protein